MSKKHRACSTCPFVRGTTNIGSAEWLREIIEMFKGPSGSHTCHRSDPQADGYIAGQPHQCVGFLALTRNEGDKLATPDAYLAYVNGDIDPGSLPQDECFSTALEMIEHHGRAILKEFEPELKRMGYALK